MSHSKNISAFKAHTEVTVQPYLEWYDRPILFPLVTDRGQELCILVDETEPMEGKDYGDDIFASVKISEDGLLDVVEGRTDLRSAYEGVKNPRLFIWSGHGEKGIRYQDLDAPLPEKYLSDKGAYLDPETNLATYLIP